MAEATKQHGAKPGQVIEKGLGAGYQPKVTQKPPSAGYQPKPTTTGDIVTPPPPKNGNGRK